MNYLTRFLKTLLSLVLGVLGFFASLIAIILIGVAIFYTFGSKTYASRLFKDHMAFDHVLASSLGPLFANGWYCAYAVVELPDDAPTAAPPAWRDPVLDFGEGIDTAFGGDWFPTAPHKSPVSIAAYLNRPEYGCRAALGDALTDRMIQATITPGGWIAPVKSADWYVYSEPTKIAYRLRIQNN